MKSKRRGKKPVGSTQDDLERSRRVVTNQQALIEELADTVHSLRQKLAEPRVGCPQCRHTGMIDCVDMTSGLVARVKCNSCESVMNCYIDDLFEATRRATNGSYDLAC